MLEKQGENHAWSDTAHTHSILLAFEFGFASYHPMVCSELDDAHSVVDMAMPPVMAVRHDIQAVGNGTPFWQLTGDDGMWEGVAGLDDILVLSRTVHIYYRAPHCVGHFHRQTFEHDNAQAVGFTTREVLQRVYETALKHAQLEEELIFDFADDALFIEGSDVYFTVTCW